jgi:MFS family permease
VRKASDVTANGVQTTGLPGMEVRPRGPAGGLRRYLAAAVLVRLADEGARVALVLLALQRTGSAGVGGVLIAALLVPHVAAAPVIGLLTDRARQPRWVLTAGACGFATSLAGTAAGLGRAPLPLVVLILLAGGCCGPGLTGALTSQIVDLVAGPALPRAFGADSMTYNVSGIIGPSFAAVVAGVLNPAIATLTLAGSAVLGAVVLATLPTPGRAPATSRGRRPPLTAGAMAVVRDKVLGTVTAASSVGELGPGALPVVAAVLTSRHHHPDATGLLMTASAVGGLVGSLLWTWRPVRPHRAPLTVMLSMAGVGAPLALAAVTSSLALTATLFALSGVFLGPFVGALFTARQQHAPEDLKAQIFSIGAGVKTTAAAGGAALAGTLAHLPTVSLLVLVGACPMLAAALGALTLKHVRVPVAPHRWGSGPLA